MDDKWFKQQQKRAGVTAEDIARKMGRTRSNVSHIYSGEKKMSLEWAQAFSETLDVPVDEVLRRAGVMQGGGAPPKVAGLSEGDAVAWPGPAEGDRSSQEIAKAMGGARPGIDIWQVSGSSMQMMGLLPGDRILVNSHEADRCKAGDVVLAQRYSAKSGTATTILRRLEPPVLVPASANPDDFGVDIVDGDNVVIRGRVVGSWRV